MRFWAKAAGGGRGYGLVKRSAHRCDGLHAAVLRRCRQSARAKLRVVPRRVRAIGHYLQQVLMRNTSDSSLVPARFSLSQLKRVLAASKTLASKPHEGRTAVGVSEDVSLAYNGSL